MISMRLAKGAAVKLERRPAEAPHNLRDIVLTLAEVIRFSYAETLGKWHLLDLPRAIFFAIVDKRRKTIPMVCTESSDYKKLEDPELLKRLYDIKECLTRTMLFSKKSFRAFLFAAGFSREDVILRKRRARILKPAFTVIRDKKSECLFVFIRGTQSITDTLTDAIGAPVSFNHFIYSDGELKRNNKVSGHGHRGMVAAAGWIKKHCTPILLDELRQRPHFQIRIVGHSLGGGTAALLTYMLREIKQFSSCTCVTFGPAASVSLELSEFGRPFIVSVINDLDVVPTLSASSVEGFIKQGKVQHENILSSARSSITAIGSRLPFASTAKAIADHAATRGSQIVKTHKQRTRSLLSWSKNNPEKENGGTLSSSKSDNLAEASRSLEISNEVAEEIIIPESTSDEDESNFSDEGSDNDDEIDEEEQIISAFKNINTASDEELLNHELEKHELQKQDSRVDIKETQEVTTRDITEDESNNEGVHTEENGGVDPKTNNKNTHALFPPGTIMHIVPEHSSKDSNSNDYDPEKKQLSLYEPPKHLYGELRVSKRMILDHMTNNYLKMLDQLISQLQNGNSPHGG
ncbi:unnamed protein product [Sphenostylis stenocarpa]|uniref:Fungal lipase-type domain-containing protein n=1 Tax=Sphenostylis stenocarpa TaxID=92480 RepID=A0AA86RUH1_9FABA|nr:unnamed protein product [Sphenostylis stenocarpa]